MKVIKTFRMVVCIVFEKLVRVVQGSRFFGPERHKNNVIPAFFSRFIDPIRGQKIPASYCGF